MRKFGILMAITCYETGVKDDLWEQSSEELFSRIDVKHDFNYFLWMHGFNFLIYIFMVYGLN